MSDKEKQPVVMVIDDTPEHLKLLSGLLAKCKYEVITFERGDLALKEAEKSPPNIVLLDIKMPIMDGFEVCERFIATPNLMDIPIIFISDIYETLDKVRAFQVGGADYITKPFKFEELKARIGTHLKIRMQQKELAKYSRHLEEMVQAQVQEITKSQTATISALAKLAESRDDDTGRHIERVTLYSEMLAKTLAVSSLYRKEITPTFIEELYFACPLHDIGKIAIPDNILLKPDKLTEEEFEVMKSHTTIGAKNLASVLTKYPKNAFIRAGLSIARSHHEWWDGTGYPDGSKREDISLYARIMTVADVYEALRSNKCYRKAVSHKEACETIIDAAGSQFDPYVIEAFEQLSEQFERVSNEKADEYNG